MAKNRRYEYGRQFPITVPSGTVSGDPVVSGQLPGVAVVDRQSDGTATCQFDGVYDLAVGGVDQSGNSAVVEGNIIYYTSGDTPKLNKKNTGVRFGYALGAGTLVASGGSGTIAVKVGY